MIDAALSWLAARFWRRRIVRAEVDIASNDFAEWKRINPGKCMYCSYTRWANEEHGQNLKIEVHRCVEGNGPAHPLPTAKARRR